MKYRAFLSFWLCLASATTWASESIESVSPYTYNQLITVQAGPFHPSSIKLSNGSYAFDYAPDSLDSYMVEAGWSARLFPFYGSWSIEENLAFSSFSGALASAGADTQNLSVYMMGLDTRLMWSMDWFPWRSLIPYLDGGYQYTFYFQSGSSDLQSSQGGVGNFVTGAGLLLWINRGKSISRDYVNRFDSFPLFLTAKVNHIFLENSGVDLGSTNFLAGLSVGL